jgi:tRNA (adenine37-N6)-methyltransferase
LNKELYCSECQKEIRGKNFFFIDGQPVCYHCLFGEIEPISIYPIGKVSEKTAEGISKIDLFPYQEKFMHKLDEEERISVIYYLHEINSVTSVFKRGKNNNGKEVGVFASHTPHRTSRIAISEVDLIYISGVSIYVKGLDAFVNSPVLDIKGGRTSTKHF